jgi:hypothetical protein
MKPYHIVVHVGDLDAEGRPDKFGTLGADTPEEAEKLVMQIAGAHAARNELCSIAVFQLYTNYPRALLSELVTLRKVEEQAAARLKELERHKNLTRELSSTAQKLREENARLSKEAVKAALKTPKKSTKKKPTKKRVVKKARRKS